MPNPVVWVKIEPDWCQETSKSTIGAQILISSDQARFMPYDALDENHLPLETYHAQLKMNAITGKFIAHGFENGQPNINFKDSDVTASTNSIAAIINSVVAAPKIITVEHTTDDSDADKICIIGFEAVTIHPPHPPLSPTVVDLTAEPMLVDLSDDTDPTSDTNTLCKCISNVVVASAQTNASFIASPLSLT